jgi:mRNA-degrading endonuclease toxin of MazEF toxin-antitoxin module
VSLGRLTVGPLPERRANYPIEVTTECRVDGTVAVEAYDAHSGVALSQVFGSEEGGAGSALALQRTLVETTLINNLIQ